MELNPKQDAIIRHFVQTINDLVVSNDDKKRVKRDLAAKCKALEIASLTTGYAGTMASETSSMFSSASIFGAPVAYVASTAAMAAYTAQFGVDIAHIELGCDDIPFIEIKEIMDKRFNKLDEALDRNYNSIVKVDQKVDKVLSEVQQTRIEMYRGFTDILKEQRESNIYPTLSDLKTFVTDFDTEAARINDLSENKYIVKINETIKVLKDITEERRPGDKTLFSIVNDIINQNFAIPKCAEDSVAWSALFSLHYAAQTYVSIILFLVKQYSRLADYYYNDRDIDKYNFYFDELETAFNNFKSTLTENNPLFDRIIEVMEKVKAKDSIGHNNDLSVSLNIKIEALKKMKIDISGMKLPIITGEVDKLNSYSSFDGPSPVEDWAIGGVVSYALQYKTGKLYSQVGKWTPFSFQSGQANPVIRIPIGPAGKQKLVFRKFNNDKAQLVGVIDDENVAEFHDINRDLYNAVLNSGMNDTETEHMIDTLLEKGLDMDARFAHGRTAIHAAALGRRESVAKILLKINPSYINMPDDNGYTPLHVAAEEDDDNFIGLLIQYGVDVNAQTYSEKSTALHIAARGGRSFAIKALLEAEKINIYARDADGLTPLHLAVSRGISVVELLTKNNFGINEKSAGGITPLHMAAMNKNLKFAKSLAKYSDFQVNSEAAGKLTPLHYAVLAEHLDMVKFLLQYGADVNAATSTNWTPLHFAVSLRNEDIVKTLLSQQNIQIDPKVDGSTPFHLAVGSGQVSIAEKLLVKGANIQATTKNHATPLHIAAMHKNVGMVDFLLTNNAKLEEKVPESDDPSIITPGYTPLLTAALIGNLDIVEYLVGEGANVNATEKNGDNILHIAAKNGHLNVLKYLESQFYNIANDSKVLKSAINGGHLDVVKYLIDEKEMDWNNKTIFDLAVNSGHSNIVNYLLFDKKYNVTCEKTDICKYVTDAARFGYLEMVKYLTKNEYSNVMAMIPHSINSGQTHIMDYYLDTGLITIGYLIKYVYKYTSDLKTAARLSGLKTIKYIAEKTNVRPDEMIPSVLPLALDQRNLDLIKYLVKDVDINGVVNVGNDGDSVLHCAVRKSWSENARAVFRYLVDDKGANVNARNRYGDTALNLAIKGKMLPLIELLISRGAIFSKQHDWYMASSEILSFLRMQLFCNSIIEGKQVDIAFLGKNSKCIDTTKRVKGYDVYYTTPLILAISNGDLNLANELIDNGANIRLTDEAGNTALHIAVENGYLDLTNKLIQKGADVTIENKAFKLPIILAYENFNKPIIDALNSTKINLPRNQGYHPRSRRSIQEPASPINVVKYLTNQGCHISDASEKEGTPLCLSNLNGKQETTEFKNPLCLQHNLSLGLLLLQNFLDKKYPLPRFTEMNSEKSRTFAVEITYKFEKILRNAVKISHVESSSLDFYNLFRKIEANIRNEKFSNIPKVLVDFVNDVCTNEKTAESVVDKIGKWFSKV